MLLNSLNLILLSAFASQNIQAAALPAPLALVDNLSPRDIIASKCGHSSFQSLTASTSPAVADCHILGDNLRTNGSFIFQFEASSPAQRTRVASYQSCAFGFQSIEGFYIAGDDVADLLRDSAREFQQLVDGKEVIGSEGEMKCEKIGESGGNEALVRWIVYNSAESDVLLTFDMVDSLSIFDLPGRK